MVVGSRRGSVQGGEGGKRSDAAETVLLSLSTTSAARTD